MERVILESVIKHHFTQNRKCVVNADLDGILSGMFLQHFLDWKVVGYSSCSGKYNDELWLRNPNESLEECVFIDLPVCQKSIPVIDQHFVAVDEQSVRDYYDDNNKINPNILRNKVLSDNKINHYTEKYPFGTVHFVLACLENLGVIDQNIAIDWNKQLDKFDLADLICRADRVIRNTNDYNQNCVDWGNWLKGIGGINTNTLLDIVLNQYSNRVQNECDVEQKLLLLGCKGKDGDCSNLFREHNYLALKKYFNFLSKCFKMEAMPIWKFEEFAQLDGKRIKFNNNQLSYIKDCVQHPNVFSYAFVAKQMLSITYIKEKNK
ncbi:MAG: hypothetical protein NC133_01905 [Prevotella sp.]|nr:hypothetical protein [Prevotella sp.]